MNAHPPPNPSPIRLHPPHCVVGVIGGGQLGRMMALAARRMGIRIAVWTGGLEAPAVELADQVIDAPFDDVDALERFCRSATVATVEFENIPSVTLEEVARRMPLHPSPQVVATCQHREREKQFLQDHGIPCAPFEVVSSSSSLAAALERIGRPAVLKTAAFGYDGSGQIKIQPEDDAAAIWAKFGSPRGVLEAWIPFEKEISVMVCRDSDGVCTAYDPAENQHRSHILDLSIVPARITAAVACEAQALACRIARALNYRGILGVEFFVLPDGTLMVNEMAPRPHNSGHHTIDACVTSQFEQQLRMVLGLPSGSTRLLSPAVMLNLLGDLWPGETTPPDWLPLFADGEASLHLYGKRHASARRKMGHACFLDSSVDAALERAQSIKQHWLQQAVQPC